MAIIAKESSSNYIPAPPGTHAAVCVDVVDLGMMENKFKPGTQQHKIKIVWQIGEDQPDGNPFLVRQRYTLSLHEKATLRRDLESWRGRVFSAEELQGFDIEVLIGVRCMISVIQDATGQYANVQAIMKLPKGMVELNPRNYVREKDRDASKNSVQAPFGDITDDDVPF
jgi:hypothetical protein